MASKTQSSKLSSKNAPAASGTSSTHLAPAAETRTSTLSCNYTPASIDAVSTLPKSIAEPWFSKVSQYLGLYVIYVYISGWAFGSFYLRYLGLSPHWLDLGVSDSLVSGFTILFTGGKWLWPFYVAVLLIPVTLELLPWGNRPFVRIMSTVVMVALLFPIYLVSRSAGIQQAQIDKDPTFSRLPVITFASKEGKRYFGKLLYLKGEMYFIREVRDIDSADKDSGASDISLSIYRAEDLRDVKVTGYP